MGKNTIALLTCLFVVGGVFGGPPYDKPTEDEKVQMAAEMDRIAAVYGMDPRPDPYLGWFDDKSYRDVNLSQSDELWWKSNAKKCKEKKYQVPVRKEIRHMTDAEWKSYHNAINKMNEIIPDASAPYISEYHIFVIYHNPRSSPAAHNGAAFLCWHRYFLSLFEQALEGNNGGVPITIPMWDNTLDYRCPVAHDSVLWSSELMGNIGGDVTTGPFANFKVVPECGSTLRRLGTPNRQGALFWDTYDDDVVLNKNYYRDLVCDIDCFFEWTHGGPHWYVGGHMVNLPCSPSDPIFWSHHANIDCLWEEFRQTKQVSNRTHEYPSAAEGYDIGFPSAAQEPEADMLPFDGYVNRDGLSDHFTKDLYTCGVRPSKITCQHHSECGGKYLWCNGRTNRCVSRIREGGQCKYGDETTDDIDTENAGDCRRCYCSGYSQKSQCVIDPTDSIFRCECVSVPKYGKARKYGKPKKFAKSVQY